MTSSVVLVLTLSAPTGIPTCSVYNCNSAKFSTHKNLFKFLIISIYWKTQVAKNSMFSVNFRVLQN